VQAAAPVNLRAKFDAVTEHLGLASIEGWGEIYKLWSGNRNPICHRMAAGDDSEEDIKADLVAESRIAGAINCIILKILGYSGIVQLSCFEQKTTTI
jgi:hypothetical protein